MIVRINGKGEILSEKIANLKELVAHKELKAERIVIEHNQRIVPREEWQFIVIQENDTIEIVSFVGGG